MVVTGNGKGKTTSSIGQIVRALGHGQKVCLVQLFFFCIWELGMHEFHDISLCLRAWTCLMGDICLMGS